MLKEVPHLVSVVTPVYNGEAFLDECIRSVLEQSYRNFEYIIVNNCSTDRSAEIVKEYAAKDARVRIHENEVFLTALQNFNNALRQISAESKYCKVVHADDWIYPDCLEKMIALAETNPSVGIVGSYRLVGDKVESDGLPYQNTVFPGHEIARMNLTNGPYTFGSPSALLIRSDLVRCRDKFYNEAYSGADTGVCLELLDECDFGFVHQVLSFCRVHEQSITSKGLFLGKNYVHCLYRLKKYGSIYFNKVESNILIKAKRKYYYRFLGRRIASFRNKDFRVYHKNVMKDLVEEPFCWSKILKGAVYAFLENAVDVKQHIKTIFRIFRLR